MIHHYKSLGQKEIKEIPVANSVRGLIIDFLSDGKPKKYREIVDGVGKKDGVVHRELKELIKREWVKAKGIRRHTFYDLDKSRKDLNDYILKYQAAPKLLDEVYPVRVDLNEFIQILQSTPLQELCSELDIQETEDLECVLKALSCIDIKIVGKKISGFTPSMKDKTGIDIDPFLDPLEIQHKWLAILCLIMYNLAVSRAKQQSKNKISKIRNNNPSEYQKKIEDGKIGAEILNTHFEEFHQPFKLIIEWTPRVQAFREVEEK